MQLALFGVGGTPPKIAAPDAWLTDGLSLRVLDGTCIHTPGHSPGSTYVSVELSSTYMSGESLCAVS
jgi:glyoxylase-like metal-dependent hydrolase (beta-lactamase superfamily II)